MENRLLRCYAWYKTMMVRERACTFKIAENFGTLPALAVPNYFRSYTGQQPILDPELPDICHLFLWVRTTKFWMIKKFLRSSSRQLN